MFICHKSEIVPGTANRFNQYVVSSDNGVVRVFHNICPHQYSAVVIETQEQSITCPYHGWQWTLDGQPNNAKCKSALRRKTVYEKNGLLFDSPIDYLSWYIPSDFVLEHRRTDFVKATSDTIMDVYLDVEHIAHAHANVYDQIELTNDLKVEWILNDWGSIQLAKDKDQVRAVWIAQYPNTMIEWQPGALFITQCIDTNDVGTRVDVIQYREQGQTPEEFDINRRVWETAWRQDKVLAENIVKLLSHTTEVGKNHFRDWNP